MRVPFIAEVGHLKEEGMLEVNLEIYLYYIEAR